MNATYQIVKVDRHQNREILATGIDKFSAEQGLAYDGLDPRKVNWLNAPIERPDPRGGGWSLVYIGVYHG